MAVERQNKTDLQWVEELKSCCSTIIKNTESIIGTESDKTNISILISLDCYGEPIIDIKKTISPEGTMVLVSELKG